MLPCFFRTIQVSIRSVLLKETSLHIPALLLANIDQAACDVFTSLLDP